MPLDAQLSSGQMYRGCRKESSAKNSAQSPSSLPLFVGTWLVSCASTLTTPILTGTW